MFLFADISGFTALFEAAAAAGSEGTEQATRTLNLCFSRFIEAIETGGGSILKFGGDAILAYVPGGDDSCRAGVWISTRILQSIRETGQTEIGKKIIRMGVKVAVHRGRGLGVTASLGAGRLEYVPLGTVFEELAAIEDVSERGQIVASRITAKLAGGRWIGHSGHFCQLKQFPAGVGDSGTWGVGDTDPAHIPLKTEKVLSRDIPVEEGDRYRAYVPDAVADRIERLGAGGAAWLCEHRYVTPIFTEIRGLVPMAESAIRSESWDTVLSFLSGKLTLLRDEMRRHGGIFARTDIAAHGLKVIGLFGVSAVLERQDTAAIEAAIAFRDRIGKMRKNTKMGIAAGKSFACLVGSDRRCDFTVIGDVMNTSARLMAAAPWGEVLCLRSMTARTWGRFRTSPCKIVAKGKRLPIDASLVHGRATGPMTAGGFSKTSLIGRNAERDEILNFFSKARQGSCGRLALIAEAGVGKTTLLEWSVERWAERGGRILKGACLPHETGDAFLPWRSIIGRMLRLPDPWTEQRALDLLRTDHADHADGIASILGLPVGTGDGKLLRRMRLEAVRYLIRREREPMLLIIEDLHWAPPDSLTILDDLDEAGWTIPVMTTARPAHIVGRNAGVRKLMIGPFTVEETKRMAEDMLGDRPLQSRQIEEIHARAGGNPLYISEIFRMMVERDGWTGIPDTVQAAILCRTDRLAEFDRKILRAAAVFGLIFEPDLLSDLPNLGQNQDDTRRALETLTEGGFVESQPPVYCFHHETIQNAVYESMSHQLRSELHRQIGREGERLGKEAWWLAHHFEAGKDDERAVLYHERAAADASKSRMHESVRFHSSRALDLIGRTAASRRDQRQRGSVLRKIRGKALKQLGLYGLAIRDYREAEKSAEARTKVDAANFISSCQRLMGRHPDSLKTGLRALRIAGKTGLTGSRKDILNTIATTYWYQGRYGKCIRYADEANEIERQSADEPAGAGLFLAGNAHVKLGRIAEARGAFQTLLEIAERQTHEGSTAYALHGLGYCELISGNFGLAITRHRRGYEVRKKLGEPRALAYSTLNMAECYIEMGLAPLAQPFLRMGADTVSRIEDTNLQSDLDRICGLYELSMGRPIHALDRFRRAHDLACKLGFFEMKVKSILGAARCHMAIGDISDARRWGKRLMRLAQSARMADMTIWADCLAVMADQRDRPGERIRRCRMISDRATAWQMLPLAMRISGVMSAIEKGPAQREHRRRTGMSQCRNGQGCPNSGRRTEDLLNRLAESLTDRELRRRFRLRWDAVVESGSHSVLAWAAI